LRRVDLFEVVLGPCEGAFGVFVLVVVQIGPDVAESGFQIIEFLVELPRVEVRSVHPYLVLRLPILILSHQSSFLQLLPPLLRQSGLVTSKALHCFLSC
jgi:hypothetical protein